MSFQRPSSRSGLALLIAAAAAVVPARGAEKLSYNFQIKPILAEKCFKCHGADEKNRKGKLRLDDRENALVKKAVVPGRPDGSELIRRLLTTDEDDVMPPPKEHKAVTKAEAELLKQWIAQGAEYQRHWSLIPVAKPPVPDVSNFNSQVSNEIDPFVLARLESERLSPSPQAPREEWLRRVTFDLAGLPPAISEVDAFLADGSPFAKEKVVDRLLASSAYGERMASEWLDLARFADTYGRHEDDDCETWPYRDWVIRAFNANLPYDQFIQWQTAGDMLPGATQEMYLATAFNRIAQMSNEAGSNEDEFRWELVFDRMRTNGIAFLGLSLECARCHDHKYDPVTMRDYYGMAAFLNNIDELGLYSRFTDSIPAPSMFVYDRDGERRHADVKLRIAMKEREMQAARIAARERFAQWCAGPGGKPALPKPLAHLEFEKLEGESGKQIANLADPSRPATLRLKSKLADGHSGHGLHFFGDNSVSFERVGDYTRTHPFTMAIWLKMEEPAKRAVVMHHSRSGLDAASRGYEVILEDMKPSFAVVHFWPGNAIRIRTREPLAVGEWNHILATYDGSSRASGLHLYINGMAADCEVVRDHLYKDIPYNDDMSEKDNVERDHLAIGGRYNDNALKNAVVDGFMFFDRELSPVEARVVAGSGGGERASDWFAWYLREQDEECRRLSAELGALRDEENRLSKSLREIMVMKEWQGPRRETHVLNRGRYDAPAERVEPDVPASVMPFIDGAPRNRLGFAQWLVDRRNPLVSRVFVNRVWQMFFGRGIVVTSEDFGIQGQLPSHPGLLDWLAADFMDHGWDIKRLCRQIALSAAYGRSSVAPTPQQLKDDPDNKLLARGPRVRLTAEQLRDNALAVAGLLDREIGGASVKPYQPAGLWEDSGTQHDYVKDHGGKLFRRSLYTFWRRTLPPPGMTVFDAPTREFCKARRDRSATPLQALVIFNDPQFLEAARVLAERLVRGHATDDAARVNAAVRLLTGRYATDAQVSLLASLLDDERKEFEKSPPAADDLRRKNGEFPVDDKLSAVEVAATTMMVRAVFGYDDAVMKP